MARRFAIVPMEVLTCAAAGAAMKVIVALWGHVNGAELRRALEHEESDGPPPPPPLVWPSAATLARETSQPVSTVRKQLTSLCETGWVRRPKADDPRLLAAGVNRSTALELAVDRPFAVDAPYPPTGRGVTVGGYPSAGRGVPVDGQGGDRRRVGGYPSAGTKHTQEHTQEQNHEHSARARATNLTKDEVEAEVIAIVLRHGVAGLTPTPTLVGPAVERVMSGAVTLEQVDAISLEYKRRRDRGDRDLRWWRDLFYGRNWSSTRQDYLGQAFAPRKAAALPGNQAEWERKRQLTVVQGGVDDLEQALDASESSPDWSREETGA